MNKYIKYALVTLVTSIITYILLGVLSYYTSYTAFGLENILYYMIAGYLIDWYTIFIFLLISGILIFKKDVKMFKYIFIVIIYVIINISTFSFIEIDVTILNKIIVAISSSVILNFIAYYFSKDRVN